jgi:hypothetical protein
VMALKNTLAALVFAEGGTTVEESPRIEVERAVQITSPEFIF